MFKDKVKVTAVALVMALLMVLSVTTDLFIGLADVFRAKASEATPTDATPVTRDVTVYKELGSSDERLNLAGTVVKVYKDSACTDSITDFVLSYDGKAYGGDARIVYKNLEGRASADASKAIAKLQEQTYYYRLDKKLFKSDKDFSMTGYDYSSSVGSFTVKTGDGIQEIKLDNNMFRPTEKVATATDAKKTEAATEVVSEAGSEATPSDASTEDSEDDSESDTQVATPTDAVTVEPVVTLAAIMRAASGKVWVNGYFDATCGNYHIVSAKNSDINHSVNGDINSRVFCVTKEKWGPCTQNTHDGALQYSKGDGASVKHRKIIAYYYEKLSKTAETLAQVQHYLSLLNKHEGETPKWASEALSYTALAKGEQTISIDKTKPSMTYYKSYPFKANGEVVHTSTNVFVSEPVTVTAASSEQYFTASVPKDCAVYVYNYDSKTEKYQWTRYGSTVTLRNGDKFRFVLPKSFANKTVSLSGTAKFGGWDVYYYYPDDSRFPDAKDDFQTMMLASETAKPKFSLSVTTEELPDPVNLYIRKVDSVSGKAVPAGTSSLAGAVFRMEYFKGKDSASGSADNTWYIKTAKNSKGDYEAKFARGYLYNDSKYKSDAAPTEVDASGVYELYDGCMRITEVIAPSGYENVTASNAGWIKLGGSTDRLTGSASVTVKIGNGNVYYGNTAVTDGAIEIGEQKKRYNFKLKKVDKYGKPMAGVAFVITASDGTQHVVVTDKNGEYDSSKTSYTNVNGNDAELAKALKDTSYYATYKTASVFFTTPGSTKTAAAEIKEDTVGGKAPGPLYKGTYTVRELHRQYVTVDGVKRKVTEVYDIPETKEFTISDDTADGATIDFGEFDNYAKESMTSTAMDTDTATKMSATSKNASFTDSVVCKGLKASKQYTLMSIAVNRSTGKAYRDADGKLVAKNQVFTSNANKEKADVPETEASVVYTGINTTGTDVSQLTFFEYLVEGNVSNLVSVGSDGKPVEPANCVAKDASTNNENQTVSLISMETEVLVNSTDSNYKI